MQYAVLRRIVIGTAAGAATLALIQAVQAAGRVHCVGNARACIISGEMNGPGGLHPRGTEGRPTANYPIVDGVRYVCRPGQHGPAGVQQQGLPRVCSPLGRVKTDTTVRAPKATGCPVAPTQYRRVCRLVPVR